MYKTEIFMNKYCTSVLPAVFRRMSILMVPCIHTAHYSHGFSYSKYHAEVGKRSVNMQETPGIVSKLTFKELYFSQCIQMQFDRRLRSIIAETHVKFQGPVIFLKTNLATLRISRFEKAICFIYMRKTETFLQ